MSKFTTITDRALDLAGQAGSNLKHLVPSADKLLQTGAALGVVKTGAKVARGFVRRNPVAAVAAGVGVGLLAFVAYYKRRNDANAPIEGKAKRVEARKAGGNGAARTTAANRRAPAARKRASRTSTPAE
jgi:hypothetical protein